MQSTHKLLSNATRALHRELDQTPVLVKLLSPNLTREQYSLALSSLYQVISTIESVLGEVEHHLLPADVFEYQSRAEYLAEDLRSSGFEVGPVCGKTIPKISSVSDYLGVCYVLEGAALGSVHIARAIESQHPEYTRKAFRYWRFQQQSVSSWPVFLSALARLDNDPFQQQIAIASASRVFQIFIDHMRTTLSVK